MRPIFSFNALIVLAYFLRNLLMATLVPSCFLRKDRRLHVEQLGKRLHKSAVNEPDEQLRANEAEQKHDVHQEADFHFINCSYDAIK